MLCGEGGAYLQGQTQARNGQEWSCIEQKGTQIQKEPLSGPSSRKVLETWEGQSKLSSGCPGQDRPALMMIVAGRRRGPVIPIPPSAHLGGELRGPRQLPGPALSRTPAGPGSQTRLLVLLHDRPQACHRKWSRVHRASHCPASFPGRTITVSAERASWSLRAGHGVRCLLI